VEETGGLIYYNRWKKADCNATKEGVMDISPGTLELLAEELRREAERKQEDPRCIAA
jgi:hypothetical protein